MRKFLSVLSIVLLPVASLAGAGNQDSVIDKNSQRVVDARGECVLTKWDGLNNCSDQDAMSSSTNSVKTVVYFDFDKDGIRTDARQELDSLLQTISGAASTEATITGFADRIGNASYNSELSQRRATAVQNYIAGGVSSSNADVRAMGESSSATDCSEQKDKYALIRCLQKDRKVEIEVSYE